MATAREPRHVAVCVGINYPGTDAQLAGCVNDAQVWASSLAGRGYEVTTLVDGQASRAVLLEAFDAAVLNARYGDRVVLTYSGHGTWTPDRDGDEPDRRDEAICPADFRSAGLITDDALWEIFSAAARGVRVAFVADSCFSGTLQRFAPPIADHELMPYAYRRPRFLPPAAFLDGPELAAARTVERVPTGGRFRRSALVMSACSDTQVTYDTVIDGRPCGLFSAVALRALESMPAPTTYRAWHRKVRQALPSADYPDVTPQLDGVSYQKSWQAFD